MKYKLVHALIIACMSLVIASPTVEDKVVINEDNAEIIIENTSSEDQTGLVPEKEESEPQKEEETTTEVENYSEEPEEKPKEEVLEYKEYKMPSTRGFKSYMSYKAITDRSSMQYKLQKQYAYTGTYGIRQVYGRYCIAVGTFSNSKIGTYVDLILKNETVIPCIISDFKADVHTDSRNMITKHNGCISEFVVDKDNLHKTAKKMGDVSYCNKEWDSPVKTIKVYDKNVFDKN